ncbi:hypothetical protein A2U01_0107006, partial [Trifolium medium]|nr:hypothetical protein [Trifolium medium]
DGTNLASKIAAIVKQPDARLKLDQEISLLNDKEADKTNDGVPKKRFRAAAATGYEENIETTYALGMETEDMR